MQTVEQHAQQPPADADLDLLLHWPQDPDEPARLKYAVAGTVGLHVLLILLLSFAPAPDRIAPRTPPRRLEVTKLYDPPTELTQKAPNKGKISKELTAESIAPSPHVQSPAPGAQARKYSPPPAPSPVKSPVPAPAVVEPPRIEQAQSASPQVPLPQLPQIQQQERPASETKPKLAFENVSSTPSGAPKGPQRIAVPGSSVQDAVRELSRGGGSRGMSVGDSPADLGSGMGLNLPPSPGHQRTNLEMKSDPMGVDFRPYMLRVLATVRRNWFAVYPESAKLGTRGKVVVEFAIAKSGSITKVVYSEQSGAQALDRAAVAALSASNPLPSLPAEYKGERIVLAFTFSYNLPN